MTKRTHKEPDHPHNPLVPEPPKTSFFSWVRGRFFAGVVIAAPITITIYLVASFITWIDARIKPLIPRAWNPETYIPDTVTIFGTEITLGLPGLGVVVAFIGLTFLGAVGANLIGRSMIKAGDQFLSRLPVIKTIYLLFKQLFETLASNQETSFRDIVLVEFPKKGTWCIGFVTVPLKGEIGARLGPKMMGVFVPTTPNPTSGFFMFVPKSEVIDLNMTIEDGAKMIVSVGMVVPNNLTPEQLDEIRKKVAEQSAADLQDKDQGL